MRTCFVRAALVIGVASTSVGAQSRSMTEAQALAQLSPASPRLQAIRAEVDLARTNVQAASRWPNPRASFNRESAAGITENIVTLTQALPITGRRGLEIDAASALADAASSRADEEVRRLRADLRLAFARLLFSQRWEEELTSAATRVRDLAGVLRRREAAGDAAGFDRMRAEREAIDVESERTAATIERLRAQADLAIFFPEPPDAASLTAVPSDIPRRELPPVDDLLARAGAVRGDLIALEREIQSAQFTERAAARRVIPEPEVVAGTKSSDAGAGDVGGVFAVHATIPLFDRAKPDIAAARVRATRASAHAAQFRLALAAEIAALRTTVIERRDAADRYRESEASSTELERIALVSYDAGERGILELLDAYRNGAAARVRQAELDLATRQAEIELEFVSGWEIE